MGQISYSCIFLYSIYSGGGCCFTLNQSSGIAVFAGPRKLDVFTLYTLGEVSHPSCTLNLRLFNCCYLLHGVWILKFSLVFERESTNLLRVPLAEEKVMPARVSLGTWSWETLYLSVFDLNSLLAIFNLLMKEVCRVCEQWQEPWERALL